MVPDMAKNQVTDPLAARYGRRTGSGPVRRRPALIVTAAVVAVIGLTWLIWVALANASPPVSSRLQSYKVESATTVRATIRVERTEDAVATCRIQAKSADFAIVGEITVTVPADAPRQQSLDVTITTQRPATAAVLVGCTTPGSGRPR